jgi:hypothetical protein
MMEKPRGIIIIGGRTNDELTARVIAEIKATNPDTEIVTFEEAIQSGLSETWEFKPPPPVPQLGELVILKDNLYSGVKVKSKRNQRRKAERNAKKKRK